MPIKALPLSCPLFLDRIRSGLTSSYSKLLRYNRAPSDQKEQRRQLNTTFARERLEALDETFVHNRDHPAVTANASERVKLQNRRNLTTSPRHEDTSWRPSIPSALTRSRFRGNPGERCSPAEKWNRENSRVAEIARGDRSITRSSSLYSL